MSETYEEVRERIIVALYRAEGHASHPNDLWEVCYKNGIPDMWVERFANHEKTAGEGFSIRDSAVFYLNDAGREEAKRLIAKAQ